jgi:tryptophan synthase beta chain
MYTIGHEYQPPAIHAGGLRYHGMAPLVSHAKHEGLIDSVALPQTECFKAGMLFASTEGLIPAPESCHAIALTVREAMKCKEEGKAKTILFNLSGHGLLELSSFQAYMDGKMEDYEFGPEELKKSLDCLKGLPKL